MTKFARRKHEEQAAWRLAHLENQEHGGQNRGSYAHVLPNREWELGLWQGLRRGSVDALEEYLRAKHIQRHTSTHNLCSSWILCANLYFPFRDVVGRRLLAEFLRSATGVEILSCDAVELEYEHPDPALKPSALLGEGSGSRGSGQISPDVAFEVTTSAGPGLILVESKFTEHWFYECSGHKRTTRGPAPNPRRERCDEFDQVLASPHTQCHVQEAWGRRYWERLAGCVDVAAAHAFTCCPASRGGYQLIRQQALAEALASDGRFAVVVSAVAFDERNQDLFLIGAGSGRKIDVREVWPSVFRGRAQFSTFAHQDWVRYVGKAGRSAYEPWLDYVKSRYGYA